MICEDKIRHCLRSTDCWLRFAEDIEPIDHLTFSHHPPDAFVLPSTHPHHPFPSHCRHEAKEVKWQ